MKSTAGKRVISMIMTACIMLMSVTGLGSSMVSAEEDVAKTADQSLVGDDSTYTSYISQYSDIPYAEKEIPLDIQSASLMNGAELKTIDEESGIVVTEGSSVKWSVQVPDTALYAIKMNYYAMPGDAQTIQMGFKVDGESLFDGASNISFKRIWKDDGDIRRDFNDNDIPPKQKEVYHWQTTIFKDYNSFYNGTYYIYLKEGKHDLTLNGINESAAISSVTLIGEDEIKPYADIAAEYKKNGYKNVDIEPLKYQAEKTYEKSDSSLFPVYDRSSAATEPNDSHKIRRNTIGQQAWNKSGMWISYQVEAPKDGLYKLAIRNKQNFVTGMSVLRDIYVDGKIPFKEMQGVIFPYNVKWDIKTITDESGTPCFIHLTKGVHEIRFVNTYAKWSEVLVKLDKTNIELNQLYRKIVMKTGMNPDPIRDYRLDYEIPGLIDTMQKASDVLYEMADKFDELNGGKTGQSAILVSNAQQLKSFVKNPDSIPSRLSKYQAKISALSDWLNSVKDQPLEIDYFVLAGVDAKLPKANASFFEALKFNFGRFIASFVEDYSSISEEQKDAITVWFSGSRDQAQILRDMIDDQFTYKTGIQVNLSMVYQGFFQAILAGKGPDVAMDVNRTIPINLASRGVLLDLSQFSNYNDVVKRFAPGSDIPYKLEENVYALPSTQMFFMMFYRTDILNELGLEPPKTWDDLNKMIPIFQREHYEIGLPYAEVTQLGAADAGIGAKDIFSTLLIQNEGTIYSDNLASSNLKTYEAIESFKTWTEYYSKYKFPLQYNPNTRLRTGSMPVVIQRYDMYNTFSIAAPEIRGLWDMAPIPGTLKDDGTIDRSVTATGLAHVILKDAKNPEDCWDFLEWFTRNDVQYEYAMSMENLLGPGGRSTTANMAAFEKLPWSEDVLAQLQKQRSYIKEIPEIPASYMVYRSIDNAFRSVVYNGKNARERFQQEVAIIDNEINRKRIELGIH